MSNRSEVQQEPQTTNPRGRWMKRALWALGALGVVLVLLVGSIAIYLRTDSFRQRLRSYVVGQLEQASGGRVELQAFHAKVARLDIGLEGLTIHGREGAGEAPLGHVDRVQAKFSVRSLLHGRVVLQSIRVDRPALHVIVRPDGSTNLPEPKVRSTGRSDLSELFDMAIGRAEIRDGVLLWNEQRIPLDFSADDVAVLLAYAKKERRYDGNLQVGKVDVIMPEWRPVSLSAQANFHLFPDRLQVDTVRVQGGKSWIEASGSVLDPAKPLAQFSYRGSGNAAELAGILRNRNFSNGTALFQGQGTYVWRSGDYTTAGKLQAKDVGFATDGVRLDGVSGGFDYGLNRGRLNITSLTANLLGGTARGKLVASVANAKAGESIGSADLQVDHIVLEQVLRIASSPALPLHKLNLSGLANGTVALSWKGSPQNSVANLSVAVVPSGDVQRGAVPVAAQLAAAYDFRQNSLGIASLEANTRASRLSARGRLAANSQLNVTASTNDFSELMPLVAAWRGPRAAALPVEFAGTAQFQGTVNGRLASPSMAGHLEVRNFTTIVQVPSTSAAGAQAPAHQVRTTWDMLTGDVSYSASSETIRNGLLKRGATSIALDGRVALVNGDYDRSQPFDAHLRIDNADVAELQQIIGWTYPVAGRLNGDVQVGGTQHDLHGSGRLTVVNAVAWRQPVRSVTADVKFAANEAQLRNISLVSDLAHVNGDASWNVESQHFAFDLHGRDIRIEKSEALRSKRLHLTGLATVDATGSGTLAEPTVNAHARLQNVALNRQRIGDLNVDAVTHGADMTVTARSSLQHAKLSLDGTVHLRGDLPMKVSGDLQSANLNPLLEAVLPSRHLGQTELTMHIDAQGPAKRPRDITGELVATRLATNMQGIAIVNDGPVRLRMANEQLRVEQFRLSGEHGTRFAQLQGTLNLAGQHEINVRSDGTANLALLQTLDPNLMSGGVVDFNVRLGGTLSHPSTRGRIAITGGSFAYIDFPNGLSDVNGTMVFNEDRLQIQELTAKTGGGLLHCSGFISYLPGSGLNVSVTAQGKDIRLRYPEGVSSVADANLTLTGNPSSSVLSGDITVTRFGLNPQFDFASYLVKSKADEGAQNPTSPLNNVRLDVHVTSTPELQVQTSLARVSGNLDVRMRGTAARPVVLGRVNIFEGNISFNGTKYRVERGDVTFTNPVKIEPILDFELSARVRDYDISLGFHGSLNRLTPSYRSDPPLSSSDIISLLALGRTTEESANPAMMGTAQYQPTVTESASSLILGQALNATVSSRVQKLFGVSRIKIDPNVGGVESTGLARVTVEQQASNKLTLTYITNLNQSAQQIIQLEYNVSRSVSIVGVRDQTGVVSIDVLLRKRKR